MSPWVEDPGGETVHYERPKNRPAKPKPGSLAELAAAFNEGQADVPVESFGQKMARLKREKKALADAIALEVAGS